MPHVAAFELSPDWVCEVLSPDGGTYRILGTHFTDAKVRVEPFDAVELDLSILWAR